MHTVVLERQRKVVNVSKTQKTIILPARKPLDYLLYLAQLLAVGKFVCAQPPSENVWPKAFDMRVIRNSAKHTLGYWYGDVPKRKRRFVHHANCV